MAPLIPLSRAPSIGSVRSVSRSVSASLSTRSITPPSSLLSRAVEAADRAISHIKRQSSGIVAIPTTYAGLNSGPAPGTVAGIVLGSVAGFILILWLIYSVVNLTGKRTVVDEEVIRRRSVSRSPARRSTRRRSVSRSTEVQEVREVPRPRERRERIVVEERRREVSVPPPPPADDDDDIVEVIEEHSPARRERRSKRDSGGYRTVDPAEFGGGGRPIRKVRR